MGSVSPSSVADHSCAPDTIESYLQDAITTYHTIGTPAKLFNLTPKTPNHSWPKLRLNEINNIFLYPGGFDPPHRGHLATLQYFYKYRKEFGIVALFTFSDPEEAVCTRGKKFDDICLPQVLRTLMFAQQPELAELLENGWLQLLGTDMEGRIKVPRIMTDLISKAGFDAKLVGLLGGDKLTVGSPPHLRPAELPCWGPVDEFLTLNAERPVDYYTPENDNEGIVSVPDQLPGCTKWERGTNGESQQSIGVLWLCKALTVPGKPTIRFYASQRSVWTGISSTKIRKIMSEAHDEDLYEQLKDKVLSVDLLVPWLKEYRQRT